MESAGSRRWSLGPCALPPIRVTLRRPTLTASIRRRRPRCSSERPLLFLPWLLIGSCLVLPANPALAQHGAPTNDYWWPNRLSLDPLRQTSPESSPLSEDFDYAEAFESLDLNALVADLEELMVTSRDWWPADYGHYGPFFIRMAWHSAGTYSNHRRSRRLRRWPATLRPAQQLARQREPGEGTRLLWPLKQKYGRNISWADLLILAGTVAMDSMGFETLGFAGGRTDAWQPEDVNWGPEGEWLAFDRRGQDGELHHPFGATQMGLIYVNPQGPGRQPRSAGRRPRHPRGPSAAWG